MRVGAEGRARIGAYLLGKLPPHERDELEARILEEPGLLATVRRAEAAILAGSFSSQRSIVRSCAASFAIGVIVGAALVLAVVSLS